MKRLLHYLILAVILLGAPAFFAWVGGYDEIWEGVKSFPPRMTSFSASYSNLDHWNQVR